MVDPDKNCGVTHACVDHIISGLIMIKPGKISTKMTTGARCTVLSTTIPACTQTTILLNTNGTVQRGHKMEDPTHKFENFKNELNTPRVCIKI